MPYEFEPKDLDRSRSPRVHRTPDDALANAFEQWLDRSADVQSREIGGETSVALYELAVEVLDPIEVSAAEATAVPLAYPDRLTPNVGLFLSAAYNLADDDVVSFDAEYRTRPKRLGFRLPAGKTLLLDAPVHSTMAVDARGLVVNRTEIDTYFGYSADGVFVNCGECLTLGFDAARATVTLGTVRGQSSETGDRRGVALRDPGRPPVSVVDPDLPPELEEYLDELASVFAGDADSVRAALAALDGRPADAIVDELAARLPTHD
jgi:hypothetical protein